MNDVKRSRDGDGWESAVSGGRAGASAPRRAATESQLDGESGGHRLVTTIREVFHDVRCNCLCKRERALKPGRGQDIPEKYRVLGPSTRRLNPQNSDLAAAAAGVNAESLAGPLKSLCESLGVPFVDAMDRFANRTKAGELVYLPYDTHRSPLGHEILAGLVVEKLDSTNQLPVRAPPDGRRL